MYLSAIDMSSFAQVQWTLLLGGFGFFFFGIKFMGDGLKNVAGDRLRDYIDKYTSKPILAILVGSGITCILQSSSATSSIAIGLVRAGLMRLEQAVFLIMGANIGTTITAFLIGLSVEEYALYFVFIGVCLVCFSKRRKIRYIGDVILGFGALFFGLNLMGEALLALKELPEFYAFAQSMSSNQLLALFAGTILTAIVQSSSAVIGIVQKLYEAGGITLDAALPFTFGSNIGTTVTGILAALGGSLAARRTALANTVLKSVGTVIAMLLLPFYMRIIIYLTELWNLEPMMQIAVAHIIFNITTTIIFFPFVKQLCNLIRKILPGNEPEKIEIKLEGLDPSLAHQSPATALGIAKQAILKMGAVANDGIKEAKQYFVTGKENYNEAVMNLESIVNEFDTKITNYLTDISKEPLNDTDMSQYTLHIQVTKNIERISDLGVNIIEFLMLVNDDRGVFSDAAKEEIVEMLSLLEHMLSKAMNIYETNNYSSYSSLQEDERYMDLLEYNARNNHFERMARQECVSGVAGSVYVDILGTIERMGDHTNNIAKITVDIGNDEYMNLHQEEEKMVSPE